MSVLHFTLACCCEPEVGVFTVSPRPLCAPPACLFFSLPTAATDVVPSPPLFPMSQPCDLNNQIYSFMYVLRKNNPLFFLAVSSIPTFSLLFSSPCSLPLLPSLMISSCPSELSPLCPQCLVSVRRASSPAQMAAASPGAGSATGTTTVPTAQMRCHITVSFLVAFLLSYSTS